MNSHSPKTLQRASEDEIKDITPMQNSSIKELFRRTVKNAQRKVGNLQLRYSLPRANGTDLFSTDLQALEDVLPTLVKWRYILFYCPYYKITDLSMTGENPVRRLPAEKDHFRAYHSVYCTAEALLEKIKDKLIEIDLQTILSAYLQGHLPRRPKYRSSYAFSATAHDLVAHTIDIIACHTGIPLRQLIRAMVLYLKHQKFQLGYATLPDHSKESTTMAQPNVTVLIKRKDYQGLAALIHADLQDLDTGAAFGGVEQAHKNPILRNMQQMMIRAVRRCSARYFSITYLERPPHGDVLNSSFSSELHTCALRNCNLSSTQDVVDLPFDLVMICPSALSTSTSGPNGPHPSGLISSVFVDRIRSLYGSHVHHPMLSEASIVRFELSKHEKAELDGQTASDNEILACMRNVTSATLDQTSNHQTRSRAFIATGETSTDTVEASMSSSCTGVTLPSNNDRKRATQHIRCYKRAVKRFRPILSAIMEDDHIETAHMYA